MEELGSPSPVSPMTIDGSEEDLALANSQFLSHEELIRRRYRRTKQLSSRYRSLYWDLMEEVENKYKYYCRTYGKSTFKEDQKNSEAKCTSSPNVHNNNGDEGVVVVSDGDNGNGVIRCAFSRCKSKAMALTRYCHTHILLDSKQQLYRRCTAVAKNLPTGPSICNKPVMRSMVPPVCSVHYQFGERCLTRAVRRGGYKIPANRKPNLKLHAMVSGLVRQIQLRREFALKSTVLKAETDLETRLSC